MLHVLRRIAVDRHVAVVCTLHQPRSSLWTLFDDVMVFAQGGRVAYHGPRCVSSTRPRRPTPLSFLILRLISFGYAFCT